MYVYIHKYKLITVIMIIIIIYQLINQVRFESKVTPRYLTVKTCLMFTPSIFKLNNLLGFNFFE